ncbi:MAG: ATP-dependent zinc metalloprotease FtsH [Calditrichia bacterium]
MQKEKPKKYPGPPPEQPAGGNPSLWRYFLIFLLVWWGLSYVLKIMSGPETVEISYTQFKQQVRNDNVKEVVVQGSEVKGQFRTAFVDTAAAEKDTTGYMHFTTVTPPFEDPNLVTLLEDNDVSITAETVGGSWVQYLLIVFLPWALLFGIFIFMRRRMQNQMKGGGGAGGLFGIGRSRVKRFKKTPVSDTFEDVAGLENAKQDLQEIISYLKEPDKFQDLGAEVPKGVLLMGPPGTGKTLLARAAAGEANVPFFSISGSEFIEMFVGVGASRVRHLFETAKREAPAIIFVDEIDSVGRVRGTGLGGGHDEREQTLNQILSEMDGFDPHQSLVVIAATNRPDVLDPALTRPGRFDRQIVMELPQRKAREKILEIHSRNVPLSPQVDLANIASRTVGFSGADLKNLVNEAALLAGRENKKQVEPEDFDEARDKILLGAEREEMLNQKEKQLVAYHEAGHALLAILMPYTDPLQKVTIIPRGRALGVTEQIPDTDRHNFARQYLLSRIAVTLGGRAAEQIVFDEVTNGAASDLKVVTQIARKMICQWGMSDLLGPVFYNQGEEHPFLGRELSQPKDFSEHTAKLIDQEIQRIIKEMEEEAVELLQKNRSKLDKLAAALLEKETLEKEDILKLLDIDEKKLKEESEEQHHIGASQEVLQFKNGRKK